jgi:hypothetical protein
MADRRTRQGPCGVASVRPSQRRAGTRRSPRGTALRRPVRKSSRQSRVPAVRFPPAASMPDLLRAGIGRPAALRSCPLAESPLAPKSGSRSPDPAHARTASLRHRPTGIRPPSLPKRRTHCAVIANPVRLARANKFSGVGAQGPRARADVDRRVHSPPIPSDVIRSVPDTTCSLSASGPFRTEHRF